MNNKNTSTVTILNPPKIVIGEDCFDKFIADILQLGFKKLFVLSIAALQEQLAPGLEKLTLNDVQVKVNSDIKNEPSFEEFENILKEVRLYNADAIVGIGGGSVLDVSKLLAAQLLNTQTTAEIIGIGNLKERKIYLACIPTTSGTGSEVSPNAILVDENANKIGVISPFLVPDAAYIDPVLTISVPKGITAATGIDALSHCLEAYTNKFSQPIIDLIALEGIRLVANNLLKVCQNGADLEARSQLSLASLYGGMCLGPVNTAAAHALAYPLGTNFHISHGLSVALILPAVMEFTLLEAPQRYAAVAIALGADKKQTDFETAQEGVKILKKLIEDCGLPTKLSELSIPLDSIKSMAAQAIKVERLLKNNLRVVTLEDAEAIYSLAF